MYTISTKARVVKPDTFVVIRIVDQREDVSVGTPTYAGLGMSVGDGPTHLTYSTTMYLESKIQPDVFRINCKRWDDPAIGDGFHRRAFGQVNIFADVDAIKI